MGFACFGKSRINGFVGCNVRQRKDTADFRSNPLALFRIAIENGYADAALGKGPGRRFSKAGSGAGDDCGDGLIEFHGVSLGLADGAVKPLLTASGPLGQGREERRGEGKECRLACASSGQVVSGRRNALGGMPP
jgi:hypothetical protein